MQWAPLLATDEPLAQPGTEPAGQGIPTASVRDPIAFSAGIARLASPFVVVAAHAALLPRVREGVTMAAARWPDIHVAVFASEAAPLLLHAGLNASRATMRDPGLAAGLLGVLQGHSWSGAVTGSVVGASRPVPSTGQYLRSWLPSSVFLVSYGPQPRIVPLAKAAVVMPAGQGRRTLLVTEPGLSAAQAEFLSRAGGVAAVRPYPLPGSWSAALGLHRATQLALVPGDVGEMNLTPVAHCATCDVALLGPTCPFCRVRARIGELADVTPGGSR